MKKLLVFAVLVGVLVSCNLSQESTVINESSKQISFQASISDPRIITLNPSESVTIETGLVEAYNLKPEKRLLQSLSKGNIITITDLQPYEVYVENKLDVPATLSAGGWMDEFEVQKNAIDQHEPTWLVYSQNPKFSASAGEYNYPIQLSCRFANGKFYVKID